MYIRSVKVYIKDALQLIGKRNSWYLSGTIYVFVSCKRVLGFLNLILIFFLLFYFLIIIIIIIIFIFIFIFYWGGVGICEH